MLRPVAVTAIGFSNPVGLQIPLIVPVAVTATGFNMPVAVTATFHFQSEILRYVSGPCYACAFLTSFR